MSGANDTPVLKDRALKKKKKEEKEKSKSKNKDPNSPVRLHISPLTPATAPRLLASAPKDALDSISYHTLPAFPEKPFAFVTVPSEAAEKIKKKWHGALFMGVKMNVEEARKDKKITGKPTEGAEENLPADSTERIGKAPKLKHENEKKKARRIEGVYAGVEITPRKVARGWDKKGECLFKSKIVEALADDKTKQKLKIKKSKSGKITITKKEFEKNERIPTFLKGSGVGKGTVTEYVDGVGWVDMDGKVVEEERPRKKRRVEEVEAPEKEVVEEKKAEEVDDDVKMTSDTEDSEVEEEGEEEGKTVESVVEEESVEEESEEEEDAESEKAAVSDTESSSSDEEEEGEEEEETKEPVFEDKETVVTLMEVETAASDKEDEDEEASSSSSSESESEAEVEAKADVDVEVEEDKDDSSSSSSESEEEEEEEEEKVESEEAEEDKDSSSSSDSESEDEEEEEETKKPSEPTPAPAPRSATPEPTTNFNAAPHPLEVLFKPTVAPTSPVPTKLFTFGASPSASPSRSPSPGIPAITHTLPDEPTAYVPAYTPTATGASDAGLLFSHSGDAWLHQQSIWANLQLPKTLRVRVAEELEEKAEARAERVKKAESKDWKLKKDKLKQKSLDKEKEAERAGAEEEYYEDEYAYGGEEEKSATGKGTKRKFDEEEEEEEEGKEGVWRERFFHFRGEWNRAWKKRRRHEVARVRKREGRQIGTRSVGVVS